MPERFARRMAEIANAAGLVASSSGPLLTVLEATVEVRTSWRRRSSIVFCGSHFKVSDDGRFDELRASRVLMSTLPARLRYKKNREDRVAHMAAVSKAVGRTAEVTQWYRLFPGVRVSTDGVKVTMQLDDVMPMLERLTMDGDQRATVEQEVWDALTDPALRYVTSDWCMDMTGGPGAEFYDALCRLLVLMSGN